MAKVEQTLGKSRSLLWAAFAVGVVVSVALLWSVPAEAPLTVPAFEAETEAVVAAPSVPVELTIPSIELTAEFTDPVGVLENGEIAVPEDFERIAYYEYGPMPGELGPAVVLGHVDSYLGPAVFYSLGQVHEGDEIIIAREDGSELVFEVERLERHLQAGFPTEQVYGDIPYAGLRLITCSGLYSHDSQRYSHNLIVFARLKEVR